MSYKGNELICDRLDILISYLSEIPKEILIPTSKEFNLSLVGVLNKKRSLVAMAFGKELEGRLSFKQLACIEMKRVQVHYGQKVWSGYKILNIDRSKVRTPEDINKKLTEELSSYFNHYCKTELHNGNIWIYIRIDNGKELNDMDPSILAVYAPRSEYFLCTNIVTAHGKGGLNNIAMSFRDSILLSLASALKGEGVEVLQLTGRKLFSLQEMLHSQDSQGVFKSLRTEKNNNNPLERGKRIGRKRNNPREEDIMLNGKNKNDEGFEMIHASSEEDDYINRPDKKFTNKSEEEFRKIFGTANRYRESMIQQ